MNTPNNTPINDHDLYAISILHEGPPFDGAPGVIVSHTLHKIRAESHYDAVFFAVEAAREVKPHLKVAEAITLNWHDGSRIVQTAADIARLHRPAQPRQPA